MIVSAPRINEEELLITTLAYAKEKMKNLPSSHDWDHVARVLATAERIALIEKADIFIVRMSAILHDIARETEDLAKGKVCHAKLGSDIARQYLTEQKIDPDDTDRICECIRTHRFRDNDIPATLEAKILYDADKIDSIGAVGIGRAFLFSGEVGAKLHNACGIDVAETAAYSTEDTAYREYIVKLQHVHETLFTQEGKRIAAGRDHFMRQFFDKLEAETKGIE